MKVPLSLRTLRCEVRYQYAKRNGETKELADVPSLFELNHWRIIDNEFCYCGAYKKSHILLPIRVIPNYEDLDSFELAELEAIRRKEVPFIDTQYDLMTENMSGRRSVESHFHYHLLSYHDKRSQMRVKTLAFVAYIVIFRAWLRNLRRQ